MSERDDAEQEDEAIVRITPGDAEKGRRAIQEFFDTHDEYPHRDEEILRYHAIEKGRTPSEIAERLYVSESTIRNWLDQHDIDAPTQPREERRSGSWHPHDIGDRVVDREQTGEERSPAVVVELPGVTAENCVIDEVGVPVSALNENYPPESQVAMVAFERDLDDNASGWRNVPVDELAERLERTGVKLYAYPLPRLDEYYGGEA